MSKTAAHRAARSAYRPVGRIEVRLWGELIGAAALDPRYGYYAFRYTPEFVARGVEPPPLRMPLSATETYLFTDLPEATYKRLPALLSDALPDDFGNALIDRYMAERGMANKKPTALDLTQLVTQARAAVTGRFDGDDDASAALRSIIEVGTSAGGARAKAVIAWNPQTEEIRSGQLEAPDGFEHWLLKFDGMGTDNELGQAQGYGRIEYAYHLMARAAGIDMTTCRLLHENGRAHFMTRRFDRDGRSGRHHMQTLCALDHVDYKKKGTNAYAQLFRAIRTLRLSYEALEEAFRRMVFNVMTRNCDDHSKNFSFRLREGRGWELAPAYDLTFAHNPKGEWTHQHLMSVNGKFKDFTERDLLTEAERFAIGSARRVIDQVRAAVLDWPQFARCAGLATVQTTDIGGYHQLLVPA